MNSGAIAVQGQVGGHTIIEPPGPESNLGAVSPGATTCFIVVEKSLLGGLRADRMSLQHSAPVQFCARN